MIVSVLGYKVIPTDNFVELRNRIFKIVLLVISVTQLVVIGVAPLSFFTLVFLEIRNGLVVLFEIEIAFADDFVELRLFDGVALGHGFFTRCDGLVELTQFEIHVGFEIREFFLVLFLARYFVKIL